MRTDAADLSARIAREIDASREPLIELCGALVAAPSMNPPGRTAEVSAVVGHFLHEHDVGNKFVTKDDAAPNIVATIEGARRGSHVVFNAHMDTMQPGDRSAWSVPIECLTRRDGKLFGLGMGNMKGGLAAMCLATAILNRHRAELAGTLSFTAVSDEVMFGDRGTEYLLDACPELAGDFLVSAEGPGSMDFAVAEKGLLWIDIIAESEGGHSSRALRGATAVAKLACVLAELDSLNDTFAVLPEGLDGVSGGEGNAGLRLSLNAGIIAAGPVRSLIATRAEARLDLRLPPGISVSRATAMVKAVAKRHGVNIEASKGWDANWVALDDPLVKELCHAVREVRGQLPRFVVRLPGSDARHWRDRGTSAACYGPQPTLSAGVDDFVFEQDVVDCAKVYALTAVALMAREK